MSSTASKAANGLFAGGMTANSSTIRRAWLLDRFSTWACAKLVLSVGRRVQTRKPGTERAFTCKTTEFGNVVGVVDGATIVVANQPICATRHLR